LEFEISSQAGLYLLDQFIGFDQVIIVDAIINDQKPLGEIQFLKPEPLQEIPRGSSPHFIGLGSLVALGNHYQMSMPEQLSILGIVIHEKHEIREGLSPELQTIYPEVLQKVMGHIEGIVINQTVCLPA